MQDAISDLHGFLLAAFWLVCLFVCCLLGKSKNRTFLGFGLGLLIGPIGCIAMALMDEREPGGSGFGDFFVVAVIAGMEALGLSMAVMAERAENARYEAREKAKAEFEASERAFKKEEQELEAEAKYVREHPEEFDRRVLPTPYPVYLPAPRATPTAAQLRAEILRKYGGR